MSQSQIIKRMEEICNEFDAHSRDIGVPIARLGLAKALAETEARLSAYERLEQAARDVESADQEKMPNIGMAHALHRLYAALHEREAK